MWAKSLKKKKVGRLLVIEGEGSQPRREGEGFQGIGWSKGERGLMDIVEKILVQHALYD